MKTTSIVMKEKKFDELLEYMNRLEEALKFYADEKIYLLKFEEGFNLDFTENPPMVINSKEWGCYKSIAGEDSGERAREALGLTDQPS